jgi:signal transduction histidine kinase
VSWVGRLSARLSVRLSARLSLRRIINVSVAMLAVFCVASIVIGVVALVNLTDARERLTVHIDPALQEALRLESALVDQDNGVRGYALGAADDLLDPYNSGVTRQRASVAALRTLVADLPAIESDLGDVDDRASAWRSGYALPTIFEVHSTGEPATDVEQGQELSTALRDALERLQTDLNSARESAVATLNSSATTVNVVCFVIGVGFVLIVIGLGVGLRFAAIRPVSRLAEEVRTVAAGDFQHRVEQSGPREVSELGVDVNLMRERILQELSALRETHEELDARTQDLERSNAELEQFAYVASHDLQEPLRKVASFCQLLERRYKGQLDERADQYIGFAVDGALRMQVLINDLLAFSRVGRIVRQAVVVPCAAVLEQATTNLATAIEEAGATIEAGPLPSVRAEVPLLTAVFQNLIGNALKFRGEDPPHVTVAAERDGEFWKFSVSDNGIGIDPEYADRIFVIFQRLHSKADYPGTGIGLAMCRKIIEYHGGTIWLDDTVTTGTRFCFTLPATPSPEKAETDE